MIGQPIFRMGFCKKCFFESPYASETILKPELSTAHLGIAERDLEIERQIQLQPHIVYFTTLVMCWSKLEKAKSLLMDRPWGDTRFAHCKNRQPLRSWHYRSRTKKNTLVDKQIEKMLKDKQESIDLIECRNNVLGYLPTKVNILLS